MFVIRTFIILCILCCLSPQALLAKTLLLTDQYHKPLSGVVVELLDGDMIKVVPSEVAVMDQVGKRFAPRLLAISKGQSVRFPNSDDIRHHVYSFSQAKSFELKLYAGTPKKPIIFEQSGIVVLGCNIHDSMVGYIYVANHPHVYISNDKGLVELPDFTQDYTVWHETQVGDINQREQHQWSARKQQQITIITTLAPLPRNTFGEVFKEHHGH